VGEPERPAATQPMATQHPAHDVMLPRGLGLQSPCQWTLYSTVTDTLIVCW
jgi:hypothetical protein